MSLTKVCQEAYINRCMENGWEGDAIPLDGKQICKELYGPKDLTDRARRLAEYSTWDYYAYPEASLDGVSLGDKYCPPAQKSPPPDMVPVPLESKGTQVATGPTAASQVKIFAARLAAIAWLGSGAIVADDVTGVGVADNLALAVTVPIAIAATGIALIAGLLDGQNFGELTESFYNQSRSILKG